MNLKSKFPTSFLAAFSVVVSMSTASVFAQKVDIDFFKTSTMFLEFPEKTLPSDIKNYSVKFQGGENLEPYGIDVEAVRKEYLRMEGFEEVPADGNMVMDVRMSPIKFLDWKVMNRSEKTETKDKAGRVTSTTTYYYWYKVDFEYNIYGKLLDSKGEVLADKNLGIGKLALTDLDTWKSQEYKTHKEAYDAYRGNTVGIQRDIAQHTVKTQFGGIYKSFNKKFGWMPYKETVKLVTMDSKKHPENEDFNKNVAACGELLMSLTGTEAADKSVDAMAPQVDYFKGLLEKYKADEKSDTKIRYAALYNLAMMSLMLDKPDAAIDWAKKLIANDYDKRDGESIIKDAEALKALLKKSGMTSRRFNHVAMMAGETAKH